MRSNKIPILALIFLPILLLLFILIIVLRSGDTSEAGFRVINTEPALEELSGSEPLTLIFNQDLDPTTIDDIFVSPTLRGSFEIGDRSSELVFTPESNYLVSRTYSIPLQEVRSVEGNSTDTTVRFTPRFIPFKDQEDLQARVEAQAPFDETYPVLKDVPHETLNYRIDYSLLSGSTFHGEEDLDTDKNEDIQLTITLFATFKINNEDFYIEQLTQFKEEAHKHLRDNGHNPDDFIIQYSPARAANL